MYKKKYQECITDTSSPTPKPDVPGCYSGGRCNGNFDCCDCEMLENECDYSDDTPNRHWRTNCNEECITTSSPTPKPDVPGCYRGGRCNGNVNCCDCEMFENECDTSLAYPNRFWAPNCNDFCDAPSPE